MCRLFGLASGTEPVSATCWLLDAPDSMELGSRRNVDGTGGAPGLHVRSSTSSVHCTDLHSTPSVVVASEELDGESGWRMLGVGELLHVRPDLTVTSRLAVPDLPTRFVPLPGANPNVDT